MTLLAPECKVLLSFPISHTPFLIDRNRGNISGHFSVKMSLGGEGGGRGGGLIEVSLPSEILRM